MFTTCRGLGAYSSAMAPGMVKYRAAPISGFFLDHPNVVGTPVYETMIRNLFTISNATAGLNVGCVAAATSPAELWRCNFASGSYGTTKASIFVINSALDSWQTGCIYTASLDPGFPTSHHSSLEHAHCADVGHPKNCSGAVTTDVASKRPMDWSQDGATPARPPPKCSGPWSSCAGNPEACNSTQMSAMNTWISDFVTTIKAGPAFSKAGNGAFLHSCHTHCEAHSANWNKFAIGGVTIQQAVSKWWNSDGWVRPAMMLLGVLRRGEQVIVGGHRLAV